MAVRIVLTLMVMLAALLGMNAAGDVLIETDALRWEIGADARNQRFVDKASGADLLAPEGVAPFSRVRKGTQAIDATEAVLEGDLLRVRYGGPEIEATFRITRHARYVVLGVTTISDDTVDELVLLDVPLSLAGTLDDSFAACALALDLQTNVLDVPGPGKRLRAMAYKRFGIAGAEVAIVAAPTAQLRDVLKEAVASAPELPHHKDPAYPPIGGPWALDARINRGSYLFDFGDLTEETVDKWIELVKNLGLNQIDFHTGSSLRFGDCAPNPKLFPRGRASVKAVLDRLHEAGISAGLHTYAFFIAKDTPYVTPVPDPRLGKDATFTLAAPLEAEGDVVNVVESTADVSTATGFFIRNSVTLQIDNELITFSGATKETPFTFTGCTRGAHGTAAAHHDAAAKVYKLKECFGLFTPDADSSLLAEVAANAADTFNECGFDMMYLDALDGEDILGGGEWAWHYGSKFVYEIASRLNKPALFEMSTFHHHLWCVRARMGAWDHPARSHKKFIDIHCAANLSGAQNYLPMNLGWWAVKTWHDGAAAVYSEPTFPDDIEYLMGKALGHNMGISLMGVNPGNIGKVTAYQRLMPIFRNYEQLRHAGYFPDSVLARLREPGAEFTLESGPNETWRLRPARYIKRKMERMESSSNTWIVTNEFAAQPARLRIEALMSVAPYDAPEAVFVEDFLTQEPLATRTAAEGVTAALAADEEQSPSGAATARFIANSTKEARHGSWAKFAKTFSPPLNIGNQPAFGVWVHGDGKGELLNVQVLSAGHSGAGGIGDHYITVDFTGWRYFDLVEFEGGRIEDFAWPYGNAYATYREHVDFGAVESFSIWCNNLPPGEPVECLIGPVKALPILKARLANPTVAINGTTLEFPVEMESGSYLEFGAVDDCVLYGPEGQVLAQVSPKGEVPTLKPGESAVAFTCTGLDGTNPRARVTITTLGEPLGG